MVTKIIDEILFGMQNILFNLKKKRSYYTHMVLLLVVNSDAHWTDILGSEFMLVLCGGGFLMTLIRVSSADWGQLYLMEERGLSTYNAGGFGVALESGGVFGTTVIGAMADFAIKRVRYSFLVISKIEEFLLKT